tara:strand:+ start:361 stop:591 length:231 start_codon:yes stop_codon:yes gene_type:complete
MVKALKKKDNMKSKKGPFKMKRPSALKNRRRGGFNQASYNAMLAQNPGIRPMRTKYAGPAKPRTSMFGKLRKFLGF